MQRHPVHHVQEVYAVVLGVALVLAVEQVIDLHQSGSPFQLRLIAPFLAFVSLAFSIYHWGVTYLDRRYAGDADEPRPSTIFVDLVIGTTELLLLIGLAILISRPRVFAVGVVTLLAFEVVAGLALRGMGNYQRLGPFPDQYLKLNLATLALLGGTLLILALTLEDIGEILVGVLVLVVSLTRTAIFYAKGSATLFGTAEPR